MPKTVVEAKVIGQRVLNSSTKLIEVRAPAIASEAVPGQFVNVRVSSHTAPLLRRPFGVAGVNRDYGTFTMVYRILGEATGMLADVCSGDMLSIVGPLGNGFDLGGERPLIVGGGLGLAPLLFLAESFKDRPASVLMGGRSSEELFWVELYKDLCEDIFLTTDDGSAGEKGTVMALLPRLLDTWRYDCVYVCGPVPMMRAVALACKEKRVACQVSLEKYMACGLGACLSCAFQGLSGRKKVCKDGPVFWSEEIEEW